MIINLQMLINSTFYEIINFDEQVNIVNYVLFLFTLYFLYIASHLIFYI